MVCNRVAYCTQLELKLWLSVALWLRWSKYSVCMHYSYILVNAMRLPLRDFRQCVIKIHYGKDVCE